MKLNSNSQALKRAFDELVMSWEETEATWKDKARQEFRAQVIDELASPVRNAVNAMQEILGMLQTIRKECG